MDSHLGKSGPPLVISSGGLPGLVACWSEGVVRPAATQKGGSAAPPVVWFPSDDRPGRERRWEAVQRQVELCSLSGFSERVVVRFEPPAHAEMPEPLAEGARVTAMLLAAAVEAASLGLGRVIWPIHAGAAVNIDTLAEACDRAMLVGQLVGLDAAKTGASGVRIETPYADLTDAQIMDLALDMDVPLHAAWWCLNDDPTPCGHCAACMRWREALAAVDPAGRLDIQVLATTPAYNSPPIGPINQA